MMLGGSFLAIVMVLCIPERSRSGETSRHNAESRTGDRAALLLPVVGTVVYCGLVRVKGKLRRCLPITAP